MRHFNFTKNEDKNWQKFPALLLIALIGWALFCLGYGLLIIGIDTNWQNTLTILSPGIFFILSHFISKIFKNKNIWDGLFDRHTEFVDRLPNAELAAWIALSAGLGLYLELMIIRIHSSYFQLFAYFKNVSLLSCFLGLGIGYANCSKKTLITPVAFALIALQIIFLFCLRNCEINMHRWLQNPISEQWAFGIEQATELSRFIFVYGFIIMIFSFNTLCFIPIGQLAARLMSRQEKLYAYNWNLIGSLGGVGIFTLISFMGCPPSMWVLLAVFGILIFFKNEGAIFGGTVIISFLLIVIISISVQVNRIDIYSPYQILSLTIQKNLGPRLETSNTYFQDPLDFGDKSVQKNSSLLERFHSYEAPYHFRNEPGDVLVVGAGTGNDVAAAIRNGAQSIDAVEIDPVILNIGKQIHPESPYQNGIVTSHVNDARAFIRHTHKKYDMIVYGLLDSHVLLSGRGGIRLDSYVYTIEAFREARQKLKKDGLISLTFLTLNDSFGKKLFEMLKEAFDGKSPVVIKSGKAMIYLAGEGIEGYAGLPISGNVTDHFANNNLKIDKSTDDWPFIYMPKRLYPLSYLILICVLLVVSAIAIKNHIVSSNFGFSLPCFFLGAGFMLLETKAITELALLYGSTWIVLSVVIIAILIMAFMSNLLVIRNLIPSTFTIYILLCGSIAIGIGQSSQLWENLPEWFGKLALTGILTLPILFAGFAFSGELKKSSSITIALSSNLWGAMLGGFLEYNSMYFGFRSLYYLALIMYLLAFATSRKNNPLLGGHRIRELRR